MDAVLNYSRRQFAALAGALATGGFATAQLASAQKPKLLAGDVVDRIKKNIIAKWIDTGFRDNFKAGGPDLHVTAIACTFMSTLDVLQKAVKAGATMVITHEPTYWSDADLLEPLQDDALYKFKRDYAKEHNLSIFRVHDNWHAHIPDGIRLGWNKLMGWDKYEVKENQMLFNIPPTTLGELGKYVAKTLQSQSVRVLGDPNLPVTKVGRGGHGLANNTEVLPQVDCLLVSEAREYDSYEYVRDTISMGAKKGAIFISHEAGEEAGMDEFARWIRPLVPEVPILVIPTTDVMWHV
jgi:putative NIF3 family GTP cyclohydrolase 1 type 2